MRKQKALDLFGPDGADLMELAPQTAVAVDDVGIPFHVHFRHDSGVGDEALAIAGRMRDLLEILAQGTSVTDAGIKHIATLPKLINIYLSGTQVSDEGLATLEHNKTLKLISMRSCPNCTQAGVSNLKAALPDCVIDSDW